MGADQSKKSDITGTSTDKYIPKTQGRRKSGLSSTADVS